MTRRALLDETVATALRRVSGPGATYDGAARRAIAETARGAVAERHLPPWLGDDPPVDPAHVLAHRVGRSASTIDSGWAAEQVEALGAEGYVEVVSISATVAAADVYAEALGVDPFPLPDPVDGLPISQFAEDRDDIGAFVPVAAGGGPNVGRAMSIVPSANALFFSGCMVFYASGDEFRTLEWDRALSRPQVELVAARTSAINECFY